ncbi:hypothetical protein D3C87_1717480 [compost metagenome]
MEHGIAVHAWQADIQQHRVETLFLQALQRGRAAVGHIRKEAARLQEAVQIAGDDVVVLDDQHPVMRTRRETRCHGHGFPGNKNVYACSTLPGFMSPCGSSARLILRISASSTGLL